MSVDIWHPKGICSWCQLQGKQRLLRCLCPVLTVRQKEQESSDCSPGSKNRRKVLIFFFFWGRPQTFSRQGTNRPTSSLSSRKAHRVLDTKSWARLSTQELPLITGAPSFGMSDCVREIWLAFMKWSDRGSLRLESGILGAQVAEGSRDWRTHQIQRDPGKSISDRDILSSRKRCSQLHDF